MPIAKDYITTFSSIVSSTARGNYIYARHYHFITLYTSLIYSKIGIDFEWNTAGSTMPNSVIIPTENSKSRASVYINLILEYGHIQVKEIKRNRVGRTFKVVPSYPIAKTSKYDNPFFFQVKGIMSISGKNIMLLDQVRTKLQCTLGCCVVCLSCGRKASVTEDTHYAIENDFKGIWYYKRTINAIILHLKLKTSLDQVRSRFDNSKIVFQPATSTPKSELKKRYLEKQISLGGDFPLIKRIVSVSSKTFDHKENKHRQKQDTCHGLGKNFELPFMEGTNRLIVISKFFSRLKTTILDRYTQLNLTLDILKSHTLSIVILWPLVEQVPSE